MADRFHFFSHSRPERTNGRYEVDSDTDDDRQPPSPRMPSLSPSRSDIEAQLTPDATERLSRFALPRWSRPALPSFLSLGLGMGMTRPRPSSSHYSDYAGRELGLETPKTPGFPTLGTSNLPSTRLHLPNLQRTWTQGSNGPPSRPSTARPNRGAFSGSIEGVTEPVPAVTVQPRQRTRGQGRGGRRTDRPEPGHGARRRRRHRWNRDGRSHRSSSDEGGGRLVDENDGRRGNGEEATEEADGQRSDSTGIHHDRHRHRRHRSDRSRAAARPHPKRFLFCFPWIGSKRMRSQILRCFVSGLFLTLLLTIYLALSVTRNINNSEFTVLLILVILFVTIFFCHGLIQLCMSIARSGKNTQQEEDSRVRLPQMVGHGGYAVPRQPIRVVLARDEEAAGLESETTKISPPAYGLWRESVRVDPNRIYWMRNEAARPTMLDEEAVHPEQGPSAGSTTTASSAGEMSERVRPIILRPPSYASDDGVSYIVEARGRSIAPTTDVPLRQHHDEVGMTPRW